MRKFTMLFAGWDVQKNTPWLMPATLLLLSGCADLGYYWQSVHGQAQIWQREKPITALLDDSTTPLELKQKLAAVLAIRDFASRELALPDNGSYRAYADLERPFVVWNVFAAPEFSVRPREWCFPVAGCVAYRGYFSRAEAEEFSKELRAQGYDVYVGGVPAYSTLGWFSDPVLNTFAHYPEAEIARLLFHELAHQRYYLAGDTEFNESFATMVEQEGLVRWTRHGSEAQRIAMANARQKKSEFISLVLKYRGRLERVYAAASSDEQKRAAKAQVLEQMQQDYARLKHAWGDYSAYDRWFATPPNNAQLASVAAYGRWVGAFQALLAENDGDLARFYQAVKEIGLLPKDERVERLESLANGG